jgi:uncharacterized protein (DUF58 family)
VSALLDADVIRELEVLRKRARARVRSASAGERTSRRRGASAEFREHRPYTSGDDPRRIDWAAYARTGEPVLKLFAADEDVIVRLVVDTSASVGALGGAKLEAARRVAAAIGYVALASAERAQIVVANVGLERAHEPARGRSALPKLLTALEALEPRGGTDLARAIEDTLGRARSPGILAIVSDFLDRGPWDHAVTRAAAAGHEVVLVQVLADEELEPPWDGDFELEDAETGEIVEVTVGPEAIRAYEAELRANFARLRDVAARARAAYVRTSPSEPICAAMRRVVAREVQA